MTEFSELGLSPAILQAVADTGYTTATPIQAQAIPVALQGRDVLGIAQTGTGKTAAFTLPMIDRLAAGRAKARMPRALVLAPTRELADQVSASFEKYAKGQKLSWALLIGGVSFSDQEQKLDRGVDVLIATPGRLLDHFERGKLLMTGVQLMVVDEADRMLDMGFIPDIERIFKLTPPKRQTLFFSATMPPEITRLTKQFLNDPLRIEVSRPATTADTITQYLCRLPTSDPKAKRTALRALIERSDVNNGIVFCNRKSEVDIVAKSLKKHGFDAGAIHGDLDQQTRMRTLEAFRSGDLKLLVASDVAARGLDIPAVSHVFNFDVPHHADDYVHRIGRTGRAGRTGEAFMIVTPNDSKNLDKVLKLIGKTPEEVTLDIDFASIKDEPRRSRGDRPERGRGRGERGERSGRDRRPREEAPAEAAIEAPEVEEAVVAEAKPSRSRRRSEAPAAEAPAPAPVAAQPERREREERRDDRHDRDRSRDRPEHRGREEHRGRDRDRDRDRRGRDNDGDRVVVGFGNDIPAFLMRAPPVRSTDS
ncbi:DEAD/DEAH box helicase [Phenylobacterium deserti]|uniref:DEAD-box ATP-dependent RNA helicase RhpA n=1 Tax=Phenylobacterium deserti TaxID=1914756 RepID=A0A328A8E2_9CAUL|nr:DEAD/DEAH box helicase [Phenylobacterium deserti]RAK50883.1 RNA helicase [Phenylobacterium deserti]